MSKLYEDISNDFIISEQIRDRHDSQLKDFWRKNTEEVNRMVTNALVCCSAVLLVLIYLNSLPGFFGFSELLLKKMVVFGSLATISPFVLRKLKVNAEILKYYTLAVLAVFIAALGTENSIGIYITYILVPLISVLYFDKKLCNAMSLFSYFMMVIGVYFNSFGKYETILLKRSQMWTFKVYLIGFSMEFIVCFLFLQMIIKRAAAFVEGQQNMLLQLEGEKERYRILIEGSSDVIFDYDVETHEYKATDSIYNTNAAQKCEVLIPDLVAFIQNSTIQEPPILHIINRLVSGEKVDSIEIDCSRVVAGQLQPFYYELNGRMITDMSGKAVRIIGRLHNITKQKLVQLQAEYEQNFDANTGLYKHEYFKQNYKALSEELKNGALVYVFLTDMKEISEKYGYKRGDELIHIAAQVMKDLFQDHGLYCRMHGARFLAFLPGAEYKDGFQYKQMLELKLDEIWVDEEAETKLKYNTIFKMVEAQNISEVLKEIEHETGPDSYRGRSRSMYELLGMGTGILSDQDYQDISKGQHLLSEMMELLKNSKNTKLAINQALATIGEQFELARIVIMETNLAQLSNDITFQWYSKPDYEIRSFFSVMSQEKFDGINAFYDANGYAECYDENQEQVHDELTGGVGLGKALSMMHLNGELWIPAYTEGTFSGTIKFDRDIDRRFSVVEKYLLSEAVSAIYNVIMRMNADEANKAKSTFLSTMSHEIRTPLNAILGMADVALREDMPKSQRQCLETIKSAGSGLLTIINDILDFSKIEAGKLEIVEGTYQIMSLVYDVNVIMQARNKEKGLKIILDIPEDLPNMLFGDMVRIKQVIVNFANNAIKYTDVGSVTLKMRCDEVKDGMTNMRVSVIDTGIGIKEEDMNSLFQSFSQVDMERNHTKEGTGLGLVISQQLVVLMNGSISVESEYGQGSTFGFVIPQRVMDDAPAGRLEDYQAVSKPDDDRKIMNFKAPDAHVLIVDDNLMNLKVAQGLLEPLEMQIDTAECGMDALMLVQYQPYDIIFMDHMMPEMDGIETTQKIRLMEDETIRKVPIIALSANAMNGAAEMFMTAGMDDFVSKPIDLKKICKKIRKFLPPEKIVELDDAEIAARQSSETLDDDFVIGDLDIDEGLKNSGGPKLFLSLLGDFYKLIDVKSDKMVNCLEDGLIRDFTIEVHALKNTARMIGAMELSTMCKTLEDAGNEENQEVLHRLTPKMIEKYRSYKEVLREYGQEDDSNKKPIDVDNMKELLSTIHQSIEMFDIDRVDECMLELSKYKLPDDVQDDYIRLKAAVADVDMETIQELCTKMM